MQYPPDSGPYAKLSAEEKKKRLDAMVRIWQSDTGKRIEREGYRAFIQGAGLDEYRYSVWMRFPEWDRYDQVVNLAAKNGLGVLFSVTGPAPLWATGTPEGGRTDVEDTWNPDAGAFKVDPDAWYIAQSNALRHLNDLQLTLSDTLDATSRDRQVKAQTSSVLTGTATGLATGTGTSTSTRT